MSNWCSCCGGSTNRNFTVEMGQPNLIQTSTILLIILHKLVWAGKQKGEEQGGANKWWNVHSVQLPLFWDIQTNHSTVEATDRCKRTCPPQEPCASLHLSKLKAALPQQTGGSVDITPWGQDRGSLSCLTEGVCLVWSETEGVCLVWQRGSVLSDRGSLSCLI